MGLRITKNNFALLSLSLLLLLLLLLLFANAMFMIRSDLFSLLNPQSLYSIFPRWEILFSWFSRIFKLPQDQYYLRNKKLNI